MGQHKNSAQVEIFIRFMEQHNDLARGFVKGDKVFFEQLWEELAKELNAFGPPTKQVPAWKKVWIDMKLSVKQRLAHNRVENDKTGGGRFNKYILSPTDEQVAVICGLYAAVDGVKNKQSYGVPKKSLPSTSKEAVLDLPTSSHDADEQQEVILELPTCSHNAVPLSPPPPSLVHNSPPMSPLQFLRHDSQTPKSPMLVRNRKRHIADAGDVMDMEAEHFSKIAKNINEVKGEIKENRSDFKEITRNLRELRKLKEKELKVQELLLEENKRHHMALERNLASKLELKLKFLELQQMKVGIEPNH